MSQTPNYIEVLKKRLQQQQLVRKKIEMQLIKQKKIQQKIIQQIRQQKQIKPPNPHTDILPTDKQVELLNNPSFISSLSTPPLPQPPPQRNTLTIQMGPKPLIMPKITPAKPPLIPNEKEINEKETNEIDKVKEYLSNVLTPDEVSNAPIQEDANRIENENKNEIKEEWYTIPREPRLPKNSPKIPQIQIYGSFNTGTNLLVVLFEKIFKIQIPRVGSAKKWKHTLEIQNFPNYFHILFVKNPFSWFQSMLKQSYNLIIPNRQNLLHQPVMMKAHHDMWNGDSFNRHFSSISKLWFYYYQMYMNFAIKHSNTFIISYEEILYDNDRLFQKFSEIFNLPLPSNFDKIRNEAMKRPAKNHGNCNNLNKALKANQLEILFTKYTKHDVKRFFDDVPLKMIIPYHQRLWDLQKWKDHFELE